MGVYSGNPWLEYISSPPGIYPDKDFILLRGHKLNNLFIFILCI
jgi:hypothetical protein